MAERFKLRRDTDANWIANNPVLGEGEPGFVTDTGVLKIGDGVTDWNTLAGISGGGGGGAGYPVVDPGGGGDYLTIQDAFDDGAWEISLAAGTHNVAAGGISIDNSVKSRQKPIRIIGHDMNDTVIHLVDAFILFEDFTPPVLSGTCDWPASSRTVTGTGTSFLTEATVGDWVGIGDGADMGKVISIESNTSMTVEGPNPWGWTARTFKVGWFPEFYLQNVRLTGDDLAGTYVFDFYDYMNNCNLFVENVIDEFRIFFMDNMGAMSRFKRYFDMHPNSYGMYTGWDTLVEDSILNGDQYCYTGYKGVNTLYTGPSINVYGNEATFIGCHFSNIDLTTITKIHDYTEPWVLASGCMDVNGAYNSPTEAALPTLSEYVTPTAGPWFQPDALLSTFLVPIALNFNLSTPTSSVEGLGMRLIISAKGDCIVNSTAWIDDGGVEGRTLTLTVGDGNSASVELAWETGANRWIVLSKNANTAGTGSVVITT